MEKTLLKPWELTGLIRNLELDDKKELVKLLQKIKEKMVNEDLSKKLNLSKDWLKITETLIFPIARKIYDLHKNEKYNRGEIEIVIDKIDVEELIKNVTNSIHILSAPMEFVLGHLDYEAEMASLISENYFKMLLKL